MDTFFNGPNLAYWFAVLVTMLAAKLTFGKLWKRRENARAVLGVSIVFFWGFFMVYFGHWNPATYLSLFFGFGLGGIVKVGYEHYMDSKEADRQRKAADGAQR